MTLMSVVEALVWLSAGVIMITYMFYPFSLYVLAKLRPRRTETSSHLPRLTMVISAHNEAGTIREKLWNSLNLDYPGDRLEIMVISDGSSDGTDSIVEEFSGDGVILCRQEERCGKSAGLTKFAPRAKGEIIVFSDANSMYSADALRRLVRHFGNASVGYVVGYQVYSDAESSPASQSESMYWSLEKLIKTWESRLSSVVGGDGAIYAIRKELFQPLRDDDINDFVNPLQIVSLGYRGIFDPTAVCYERAAGSFVGEFRRRVRIVNRSVRGVLRAPGVLNPARVGWFAYQILLHKIMRWAVPYFLIITGGGTALLVVQQGGGIYRYALLAQALFYLWALVYAIPAFRSAKVVYIPYYFCVVNAAALIGSLSVMVGRKFRVWSPERKPVTKEDEEFERGACWPEA